MGRTVPTYRLAVDELLVRWEREFGRALVDPADQAAYRDLVLGVRRYIPQGTLMTSGDLLERVLLSLLLDLYRRSPRDLPAVRPAPGRPLETFEERG